jgi:hypothetical protein
VTRVAKIAPKKMVVPIDWRASPAGPAGKISGIEPAAAEIDGHDDRPQAQGRALDHRLADIETLVAQLVGELDDQDAVLGAMPDQDDQPDLAVGVDRRVGHQQAEQPADGRHRHRQHDHRRVDPALELRRQHQEHQQSAMPKASPMEPDASR